MLKLSKKIIVAIDGSPQSDKAAEEAVRLGTYTGAKSKSNLYAVLVLPNMKTPSFTDFFPDKPATEMPGWQETTAGARSWADLPAQAIKYISRVQELIETPVALVSTSPEREDTILVRDPFVD